jgi:hypothetical protein
LETRNSLHKRPSPVKYFMRMKQPWALGTLASFDKLRMPWSM